MQPDQHRHSNKLRLLFFIISAVIVSVAISATAIQAQPAAPTAIYWVTSSSNTAITTCAGAANDCSLRGAVQLANVSGATINFSTTVTLVTLSSPITLTHSSIIIHGNGQEVTSLKTNGNFPALVIQADYDSINNLAINAASTHAGTNQHGMAVTGNHNTISQNNLSDLGGDGLYITGANNTIDSNFIGVATQNGWPWAICINTSNDQWGILLDSANNNTVSHNTSGCNGQDGVGLYGNSYNNTVTDNYLGVVNWGGRVPNARAGVGLWNGATVNNIGTQGHGNVIGANPYGVIIYSPNTHDNTVAWNSVGVSGTLNISNTVDGFNLQQSTSQNWIEYNDIAYNGSSGVALVISATGNFVYSNKIHHQAHSGIWIGNSDNNNVDVNWIGVETSGGQVVTGCNFANTDWGIRLDNAWNNSINFNVIGCSGQDGVGLSGTGTYSNEIYSNWIGVTDSSGHVPNAKAGVALWGGPHNNQIGRADRGNIIGANKTFGVYLSDSGTTTNTIQLNSIGVSGTLNISNTLDGVALVGGAHVNRVVTNTIAYNGHNGVWLSDVGTNNNVLQANVIRLNQLAGVAVQNGASGNSIGPGSRAVGNLISANTFDGVYISGNTTLYNSVFGNTIGTNAAGNAADPNGHSGVTLDAGTSGNAIGQFSAERNVIAGNGWNGVSIQNGAHHNWVWLNDIGTNRDYPVTALNVAPSQPAGGSTTYLALPNGGGVSIVNAYTNTIGGIGVDNFIEHNHHTGIYLAGGSHGNIIGSNIVQDSDDYGVLLDGGNTAYNTITRTQIYSSGLDGIGERNGAGFNVWTEVGIHDNGGLGIDKSASDDGQNIVNAPNLTVDSINKQTGVVHGHADPSILGTVKVELYRVVPDPSGYGEGGVFLGRATTDVNGSWTITDTSPLAVRGCYTAFVTESQLVIPFSSSEFSANTCRVFLPLITRQ